MPPRFLRQVLRQLRVVAFAAVLLGFYVLVRVGVAGVARIWSGP